MPRPFSSRGASLTAEQAEDLLYMLEEERLAGDLYEQLATQTSLSVFSRIAESEDRHFIALLRVAERSDLAVDAITGLPSGEYANDIQDLQEAMPGLTSSHRFSSPAAVGGEMRVTGLRAEVAVLSERGYQSL